MFLIVPSFQAWDSYLIWEWNKLALQMYTQIYGLILQPMAIESNNQVSAPIYASISATTLFQKAVGDSYLAVLGERFSGLT